MIFSFSCFIFKEIQRIFQVWIRLLLGEDKCILELNKLYNVYTVK